MEQTTQTQDAAPVAPRNSRGWRVVVACVEVAILVLLLPVIVGVIAIFLATDNRLSLPDGLERQIMAGLNEAVSDYEFGAESIAIELPQGRFTPEIVLIGVEMRDEVGLRAYFPEVSVLLNGQALLSGDLRPRRVGLDGAGLRLSRDREGVIDLSVASGASDQALGITETLQSIDRLFAEPTFSELEEISGEGLVVLLSDEMTGQLIQSQDAEMALEKKGAALTLRITGSVAASLQARVELAVTRNPDLGRNDILFAFENIAARDLASASPALRWLDLLEAPITGRLLGQVSDIGRVGDVAGTLDVGPGELRPQNGRAPIAVERIGTAITFDAAAGHLIFDELVIASDQLSFTAAGEARVRDAGQVMTGQLQFSDLTAAPDGLFEAPLIFEGGALDLRLTVAPDFHLQIGQAVLFDGPLHIQAWGDVRAADAGLVTRVDVRMPVLPATDLFPYWPAFVIPGTRDWVTENLETGRIEGFAASFRRGPDGAHTGIRFDFSELTLHALDDMPPITEAAGYLSVLDERFTLHLSQAEVTAPDGGRIDLSGSTMLIEDARPRNPDARFDLAIDGPLEAVGGLLALPPVNLLAGSTLDAAAIATGWAEARAVLGLNFRRVIPREEISFSAAGTLRDVDAIGLLAGRELRADALDLTVTPEFVALAGRAELDGVGFTGRWSQVLAPGAGSRAEGRITVNAATLAQLGINLPRGLVSGSGGADFALDLPPGGTPELSVSSDLSGIGLAVPGLPWRLGQSTTGQFGLRATLGPEPAVPELTLAAAGLDFNAAIDLAPGGGFTQLDITEARIDSFADITGTLRPGRLRIAGGSVDLRQLSGAGGGSGGRLAIDAALDRLILADGIALTGVDADLSAGLSGAFQARVNGAAPISGRLDRTSQGLAIQVEADDAGAVLRAANLFENSFGGTFNLALQPTGSVGAYDGTLSINGARIRNAPAMAELLNAISVVGLLEQLGGEGINLGELDASFRIRPGAIILDEGTAVGPSIGISMDGVFESAAGRYDMQGVISPVYIVNGIAGALFAPRREGLFGFTYRLQGTTGGQSSVNVNPLSILTPGIFREIFRRPPPEIVSQ
ncbi:MAG: AsmA-like C-terminal region-containing protein [Pseudomonadota bacterium]